MSSGPFLRDVLEYLEGIGIDLSQQNSISVPSHPYNSSLYYRLDDSELLTIIRIFPELDLMMIVENFEATYSQFLGGSWYQITPEQINLLLMKWCWDRC